MCKLILFGGSGFIGKNLIYNLKKKFDIVVIDKFIDESFLNENEISSYQYDFDKDEHLNEILRNESPDFIINLISLVNASDDISLFPQMINLNFNILMKIYEASKEISSLKLMVNMGTAEEYGNINGEFNEQSRESPGSPYAITKQMTTNTALLLYKSKNFPITIIRPSNIFGKYQPTKKILPYIKSQLLKNAEICTTPAEQKRDFLSANNFAWCVEQILKNYQVFLGEIVNVGSGEKYSLKDIINYSKKALDSVSSIKYGEIPYRMGEIMDMNFSVQKLERLLQIKIKFDFYKSLLEYLKEDG